MAGCRYGEPLMLMCGLSKEPNWGEQTPWVAKPKLCKTLQRASTVYGGCSPAKPISPQRAPHVPRHRMLENEDVGAKAAPCDPCIALVKED
eukprot:CAMPEP_0195103772 /NCGR_PEP_ID=MMETSP0448-20130528/72709_1 /TAXON_ID=66468 /ORGANISM="Heterocapsa triquestra, Strain CCMP 448" /LENGTH=90 /DNA_ID=CAMNT_0040139509 /DNA_START=141 /DNA_END=413 /DNA_ORIENTATION=+